MSDETMRFSVLCAMFQAVLRQRAWAKKRKPLRTFLGLFTDRGSYFAALRLILPSLDRERGTYGLKEAALAASLVDALGISKDSEDALRLLNWRKGGSRSGSNAGNFPLIAAEVLERRQGMASGGLTIKELNDGLDRLASKESRGEKASVLSDLIKKTNPTEMKWILMIILKDLKLGMSEKSIFNEFHPDAEDLFNVTCDLKLVCEKLNDRTQRHKRQDIEVGKAVRPQLATRASNAATAWKKLHGKQVVAECKFDGDRIQIHKNGLEIHFFSRSFLDHSEYAHGMSSIIRTNVLIDRCILDGEMLVWDTSTNRFAEFGSNQEIARAAREGLEGDRQLCYVAFDILYAGDTSVIHQSLAERHVLLQKVIQPVKGHLEILLPNDGFNVHRPPGEPCWSIVANNLEDVERFFKETIENRDEGIVLKDLGSKWEPSDRSGKWLKLKPDYIHAGADLDVLIIGGYFGSGRRGGEVAQFLMGLAERSTSDSYPKRFISFCRVGSGLSDDELDSLVNKLKPHFRRNEYPRKSPRFYEVTYNAKERPDVWVDSPDKSIILSITSDIRTIKSEVFAAPYSLRFPRIDRVRYDKPWHDCLDVQSFMELVHSSNGSTQRGDLGISQDRISKNVKSSKKSGKNVPVVPAHLKKTDVSDIKGDTLIFASMMFYFANIPSSYSLDYFHKLVAENGGTFSMNSNDSVTHCIAAEKKGIKYRAAARRGDIIHYSWVLDCCVQKHLLHLQPKYFLFIAESSKRKLQDEIDLYSDYYYWDIDLTDLKQMFSNMEGSRDVELVRHYKKYCPTKSWCLFQDCCFYFCEAIPVVNMDHKVTSEVALKRMKLDVVWRGGEVSNDLSHATHLVAYSTSLSEKLFDIIYECCPSEERYILHGQRLHVVSHLWLEDSMDKNDRLPEDAYNLRPDGVVELNIEASAQDSETLALAMDRVEKQRHGASLDGERAKKRGRPAKMDTTKRRAVARPARTRARIRNQPAKLSPDESDTSVPSDENIRMNDADINVPHGMQEMDDIKVEHEISGHSDHMHETIHNKGKGIFQDDKGQGCPEATVAIPSSAKNNALDDRNLRRSDGAVSMEEEKIGTAGKHEIMYDPVQAMLLDMIPSLSQKTIETGKTVLGEKQKPETDTIHTNPVKKKVSYKDVAGQLLGDF